MVWPLWLKKPGLTERGVATGVTKFHMASVGLLSWFDVSFMLLVGKVFDFQSLQMHGVVRMLFLFTYFKFLK